MSAAEAPHYETLLYEVADRVATVTLNRPEAHNALNVQLRTDLVDALHRAENDNDVSLVLLKGAGKSFCAGYDLKNSGAGEGSRHRPGWVSDPDLEGWTDQFARSCVRDWMTLWDLLKPVVAQVHGNCLAGGMELMSFADIAFVADDARLGYPPMRAMSTPDVPVFPWKMTMAQAKYLQLTGNSITGKQAAEWGWVVKSFPADELDTEVQRELQVLSAIDAPLLAANKMAVNHAYETMGIKTHLQQTWIYHHLSIASRGRSQGGLVAQAGSLQALLEQMNGPARQAGIL